MIKKKELGELVQYFKKKMIFLFEKRFARLPSLPFLMSEFFYLIFAILKFDDKHIKDSCLSRQHIGTPKVTYVLNMPDSLLLWMILQR